MEHGKSLSSVDLKSFFPNRKPSAIQSKCQKVGISKTEECRIRLAKHAQQCMDTRKLRKIDQNITINHLDNNTRQILIGSILGDGCVQSNKGNSFVFSERHEAKQKDYVLWKQIKLDFFKPTYSESHGPSITTPCHEIFDTLRALIYPNGKNVSKSFIPCELINKIDFLGLMIWYLDDGYLGRKRSGLKSSGRPRRTYPHITCKGYDESDLRKACDIMNENMGLSFYVRTQKHKEGINKLLCMNLDKNRLFPMWQKMAKDLMLPECMYYKLNMQHGPWVKEKIRNV